jgi:SAM-dependent methyltransferase
MEEIEGLGLTPGPATSPSSDPWRARLEGELRWWRTFLGERLQDDPEYRERFDPDRQLQPHVARLLPQDRAPREIRILDCAAGPVSALGRVWRGAHVQLVAVDVLAEPYRQTLERLDLRPPVPSGPGTVEDLDGMFAEASFDLVYMRNALDHCRDPALALEQMLKVARPGGAVLIEHYNEDARPLIPESLAGASIEADYSDGRMTVVIRRR